MALPTLEAQRYILRQWDRRVFPARGPHVRPGTHRQFVGRLALGGDVEGRVRDVLEPPQRQGDLRGDHFHVVLAGVEVGEGGGVGPGRRAEGGADHQVLGQDAHDLLGDELGEGVVVAHRAYGVVLAVVAAVAPEDVVGGDVDQEDAGALEGLHDVAGSPDVDGPALLALLLGPGDVGVGGCVEEDFGLVALEHAPHALGVGDVELAAGRGYNLGHQGAQGRAQAAAASGHEDRARHSLTWLRSPSTSCRVWRRVLPWPSTTTPWPRMLASRR